MTDVPTGAPPGWPTDEHRERVAAHTHALRGRRLAIRATAFAVAIVVLGGGLIALRGSDRSDVKVATGPSTTAAPSSLRTVPYSAPPPKGWRVVDFGNARLAAPPGWKAIAPGVEPRCAPTARFAVTLYRSGGECPWVRISEIRRGPRPARAALRIHGIPLYVGLGSASLISYDVPELGVTVTLHGVDAAMTVLRTLTTSARLVATSRGPSPKVPADWRTITYAGITLRVPPTMPITQLGPHDLPPGECSAVQFPQTGAFVGRGVIGAVSCPVILAGVVAVPTDGVWVSTVPAEGGLVPVQFLPVPGLTLWFAWQTNLADPTLVVEPTRRGDDINAVVRLGLGVDPTVARTILFSIRATN